MQPIYNNSCPACGGSIDSYRLSLGLPCRKCLSKVDKRLLSSLDDRERLTYILAETLEEPGDYMYMYIRERDLKFFQEFFENATGFKMWSIQRTWALRLLNHENFALIAPTGLGKSTLLHIYSLYIMKMNKKIYFITPTIELAKQTYNRLIYYAEKTNNDPDRIFIYDSRKSLHKKSLEVINNDLEDFIFISTSSLLARRFNDLSQLRFDLVVADDLDAILKRSRNVERILRLLGYSEDIIDTAFRITILKQNMLTAKILDKKDLYERYRIEIEELRNKIVEYRSRNNIGQFVIASATGREGMKTKILRETLDLEVGGVMDYVRNIIDTYMYYKDLTMLKEVLQKLGEGTIIYVSQEFNEDIKEIYKRLMEEGFEIGIADSRKRDIEKFLRGDLKYLIASASFYGTAVRGLDSPKIIRNAVFLGVPSFTVSLEKSLKDPRKLLLILSTLASKGFDVKEHLNELMHILSKMSVSELYILKKILNGESEAKDKLKDLVDKIFFIIDDTWNMLRELKEERLYARFGLIDLLNKNVLIPDPLTYIQASGRTSRILNNRFTLGLSLILYREQALLELLIKRLKRYLSNVEFKKFDDIDLETVKKEQEKSRTITSVEKSEAPIEIKTVLMIVESPTKVRTISELFGSKNKRVINDLVVREFSIRKDNEVYVVTIAPSIGHVTDLVKDAGLYGVEYDGEFKPVYNYIKRCLSCGYQFVEEVSQCPRCGSSLIRDQRKIIDTLRRLAYTVDIVMIATDPDPEGEKIAYDLKNLLRPYNPKIFRIEFHEITRKAILDAITKIRDIDNKLVSAQILRRIDDRWVGFLLSRELQNIYRKKWLGAGRVQTPVLSWIVEAFERYRSNKGFWLYIKTSNERLGKLKIFVKDKDDIKDVLKRRFIKIRSVKIERKIINPQPPFTTDSLLTSAGSLLGYSPKLVMKLAQDLFEAGLITYHRTDSTHISSYGIDIAKRFIIDRFGEEYVRIRSWGAEGAHEAIRPTYPYSADEIFEAMYSGEVPMTQLTESHIKLYDLIFRRFIASQMKEAEVDYCVIEYEILDKPDLKGSVEGMCRVYEEGFMKIYNYMKMLPQDIEKDDVLEILDIKVLRGSLTPLYKSSEIIKMMKERGIGRPSTYVKAIENNLRHGYVIESRKRRYLIPTKLGIEILKKIREIAPEITSEEASRALEKYIDKILYENYDVDEVLRDILREIRGLDLSHIDHEIQIINKILGSLTENIS